MRTLLALLLAASAGAASAQVPTRGLTLGARLYGASLDLEDDFDNGADADTGGGIGVEVGYGVSRAVTVFLALEGAQMDPDDGEDYALGTADLGVRAHLRPSARLNPYLQLALTGQTAAFDVPGTSEDLEVRGGGLTLGAGLLYGLSRSVALDVGLDLTGGRFTEAAFDGESTDNFEEIDAGIGRLGIGVVANL